MRVQLTCNLSLFCDRERLACLLINDPRHDSLFTGVKTPLMEVFPRIMRGNICTLTIIWPRSSIWIVTRATSGPLEMALPTAI